METFISDQYLAGFFDGEGCLSMGQAKGGIYLMASCTHTYFPILEYLQDNFNGCLFSVKKEKPHHKHRKQWSTKRLYDIQALIERLGPYIVEKKPQFDLALRYIDWRFQYPYCRGFKGQGIPWKSKLHMIQEMKDLKR